MKEAWAFQIGDGEWREEGGAIRLVRVFPDGPGRYEIPYFQTGPDLDIRVIEGPAGGGGGDWELCDRAGAFKRTGHWERDGGAIQIRGLAPAEYDFRAIPAGRGAPLTVAPIGVGTGVAALGDSITEGYWGRGYGVEPDVLWGGCFPAESCSRDGRNFPQYAPTASVHAPGTTCFESWMSQLNDRLTAAWGRPVFIANEGWGGYTTRDYLRLMETDRQWEARLRRLAPQVWLIHLGVNDERAHRPPAEFGADLRQLWAGCAATGRPIRAASMWPAPATITGSGRKSF
jgi:lysophospholipase L1-like esterase